MAETYTYTGRANKSLGQKLNPIWWFQNDDEQKLDDGTTDWYMPGKPQWMRKLFWEFRNPLQNFRSYVLGVQDRNYTVRGRVPVLTIQRNDMSPPELGLQWCVLYGGDIWVPRPFASYSGVKNTWYAGWQPNGFFGAKANGTIAVTVTSLLVLGLVLAVFL